MNKLTGLVLCGGQSSRMNTDKSLLNYHGQPQRYYIYQMLSSFCKEVFISCSASQVSSIAVGYNYIVDSENYNDIGPMVALLSAFNQFPDNSFLVLACDYPFLKGDDIEKLVSERAEEHQSTAFYNSGSGFYEPLLAVYESSCYSLLKQHFNAGNHSLQQFLKGLNAKKIFPSDNQSLKSVDTVEEYESTLKTLRLRSG